MKTQKKKKTHGGPRPGSGRKPVDDKKELVPIYVPGSAIALLGGLDAAKEVGSEAIIKKARKLKAVAA